MKTSQNLGRENLKNKTEIHQFNIECRVGHLEVEFVNAFLGGLPGLSCRWTSSAGRGAGLSRIELEESYSGKFLMSPTLNSR